MAFRLFSHFQLGKLIHYITYFLHIYILSIDLMKFIRHLSLQ